MVGPSSWLSLEMLARDKRARYEEEAARERLLASGRPSAPRDPVRLSALVAWLRPAPRATVLCCPQAV